MPVTIKIDQAGKPPGVAGVAREDLVTGTPVQLSAQGGPYAAYLWKIVHKPIDIFTDTKATSLLSTPSAQTTLCTPIDVDGTYHVEVSVDSGAGLGANEADIARITFYAGPQLNPIPERFPRRIPAFQETTEHNVPDAISPAGNDEGWSREWYRWFAVVKRLYDGRTWSAGRVTLTGAGATLVRGFNVAGVTRLGLGRVRVDYTLALPDANYAACAWARGSVGGSAVCNTELAASFIVERADLGGSLVDEDFNFAVLLGA